MSHPFVCAPSSHHAIPTPRRRTTISAIIIGGLLFGGCGGNDPTQDPTPASSVPALTSEIIPLPLSTTEADRLLTIIPAPGDRYYAAGFVTENGDSRMAVVRLLSTGALDPSFGQGGLSTINVAVNGQTAELARGLAVQSDGKVVIAGPIEHDPTATGPEAQDTDIALVRFDTTGQVDPTFGINGVVRLDLSTGTLAGTRFRGDTSWGLTVFPNDDLLVVGGKLAEGSGRTDVDYAIMKLERDGAPDLGFGSNGLVTLDVEEGNDNPRTAIIQPDGKIVVSGHTSGDQGVASVLFRLLPSGQFDSSFGQGGVVNAAILPSVAEAYDVAFQGNALVIAGYGRALSTEQVNIISARFLTDGTWDQSYGTNGVAVVDVANEADRSRKVEVLPDGRVLLVGQGKPTPTAQDGAIVLLTADGQPDPQLNGTGLALVDFGGEADALFGLALSADKTQALAVGWKGVDSGTASSANNDDARVVRLSIPAGS